MTIVEKISVLESELIAIESVLFLLAKAFERTDVPCSVDNDTTFGTLISVTDHIKRIVKDLDDIA